MTSKPSPIERGLILSYLPNHGAGYTETTVERAELSNETAQYDVVIDNHAKVIKWVK
jgi:hypothetical protein